MGAGAAMGRRSGPAYRAQCSDRLLPSPRAARAARAPGRTAALGGPLSPGADCGGTRLALPCLSAPAWPHVAQRDGHPLA